MGMMVCNACGGVIDENHSQCPLCGVELDSGCGGDCEGGSCGDNNDDCGGGCHS